MSFVPPIPFLIPIPEPISTNAMHSTVHGRKINSPAYRRWIEFAVPWVNSFKKGLEYREFFPLERGYQLTVYMVRWNNRVKDISNYIKSAEDLMVRCAIILDDRHLEGTSSKWISKTDWAAIMERKQYPEFTKAFIGIEKHTNEDILKKYYIF